MAKTFLLIPTTFLTLWLSGISGFNFPLTKVDKPTIEKSIVETSDFKSEYKVKTIVIDAGHGGRDGGCSGAHSLEKEINLKIAKKVKAGIERKFPEMTVIMTRDKDVFIPLHKRAKIANENEADLFLSIHCNAIKSTRHIHGSETYVLGLHNAKRNLEVAKRENDVVFMEEDYEQNYGFDPNSPAGHIMMSAFQNSNLEQSILFAEKIETHIKLQTPHRSRGVKQAGFHVLREVSMPSVLLETGYLTSKKDEEFLSNEQGQNYISGAIVNALSDFKKQVETGIQQEIPRNQFANNPPAARKKLNLKPRKEKIIIQKKEAPKAIPQVQKEEVVATKTVEKSEKTPEPIVVPKKEALVSKAPTKKTEAPKKRPKVRKGEVLVAKSSKPEKKTQPVVISEKEVMVSNTTSKKEVTPRIPATQKLTPEPKPAPSNIRVVEEVPVVQKPEVAFKIQIAASKTPIDVYSPKLIQGGYIVKSVQEAGMLKYQTGISQDFRKAIEKLNFVKKAGFKDAFIVAYNRDRKISIQEAKRLTR